MRFCLILCLFLATSVLFSQKDKLPKDSFPEVKSTTKTVFKPNPKKSAFFSAIFPGGGQIYNRRYHKAPIVWVVVGTFTYLYISQNNLYQEAKTSYLTLLDTVTSNNIPFRGSENLQQVQSQKNQYRNNRDLYLVIGIICYGLQVVEALVDAHLIGFEVTDNLSINAIPIPTATSPLLNSMQIGGAMQLTWNFSKNKNSIQNYKLKTKYF